MALSDLSFKLYTNSTLTTSYSGLSQLQHKSDLSDNPQVIGPLYFGSTATGHTLQTVSGPGVNQIALTPTDIEKVWSASSVNALNSLVEPTNSNGYIYKCTGAGTSGVVEPTWPLVVGSTVSDGTTVWTCYSPKHPITEIKLATTQAGLAGATAGAPLNLGTTLNSGVGNAVAFYIQITNTVTQINNNTGFPQLGININPVQEVG